MIPDRRFATAIILEIRGVNVHTSAVLSRGLLQGSMDIWIMSAVALQHNDAFTMVLT